MINQKSCGFTLLEMLVVVLIIAVLISVAAPQYKLAVARVRYLNLQRTVRKIMDAEQHCLHATGDFTADLDQLALDFPVWKNVQRFFSDPEDDEDREFSIYTTTEDEEIYIKKIPSYLEIGMYSPKMPVEFIMFDWHFPDMLYNPDVMKTHLIESYCHGDSGDLVQSRRMCKAFGAQVDNFPGENMWKF